MNDFDDRAQTNRAAPFVVEHLGRKKKQRGAQALAPTVAEVFADFRDGFDVRDGVPPELALNGGEVLGQHGEDFFSVNGGRGGQVYLLSFTAEIAEFAEKIKILYCKSFAFLCALGVLCIESLITSVICKLQINTKIFRPQHGNNFL